MDLAAEAMVRLNDFQAQWRQTRAAALPANSLLTLILLVGDKTNGFTLSWETNDPRGGEVRVILLEEQEKIVTRGRSGSIKLPWVQAAVSYRFALYSVTAPQHCLDVIDVPCSDDSIRAELEKLAFTARRTGIDLEGLARLIAKAAPACVRSSRYPEFFRLWEAAEVHLTPVHFYQPIPDTRALPADLWDHVSDLRALRMNDPAQLDLLRRCFPVFRDEYEKLTETGKPGEQFSLYNGRFDASMLWLVTAWCAISSHATSLKLAVGILH